MPFMLLSVMFVVCLIVSNLIEIKTVDLGWFTVTAGLVVFPVSYIINDCVVEVYGFRKARLMIWVGFGMSLLTALFLNLAILLPGGAEYQGRYGRDLLTDLFGLPGGYFHERMLSYYGDINLMKGGIYAADYVTTVSPPYAQEIRYDFYAHGLAGVIADNAHKLRGILNGIDVGRYDPWRDQRLPRLFNARQLKGKKDCKAALQTLAGLTSDPNVPVIGCVSRLVPHKGFDLVVDALPELMATGAQMVVLGTGEWRYEEAFRAAAWQYPGRFSAQIMYSDAVSTAIYGGADLFLMPSVSEPCGLSQMIAMRYGTLPIVRETGGLKDSVQPWNKFTGEGTGFTFTNVDKGDMVWVTRQAVELYHADPKAWKQLQQNAMTADFSWDASAKQYEEVYGWVSGT